MQVMIYIKNQDIMDSVKAEAGKLGKSVSSYLLMLHQDRIDKVLRVREDYEVTPPNTAVNPAAVGVESTVETATGVDAKKRKPIKKKKREKKVATKPEKWVNPLIGRPNAPRE